MASLSLVLFLHQSYVLKPYSFLEIGSGHSYFDEDLTEEKFRFSIEKSQIPVLEILSKYLKDSQSKFQIALSISGTALEMIARDEPILLKELKSLYKTGKIEFLAQPFYASLACLYSKTEFERQVNMHKALIKKHFGKDPKVFHNTGLIFDDKLSTILKDMKFEGAITEGATKLVSNPNYLFESESELPILTRNYGLSDNLTFRNWSKHPFDAVEFAHWIKQTPGELTTVFVDWDLFGVHHGPESGIFDFLSAFCEQDLNFMLPSQACSQLKPKAKLAIPEPISWFGASKDLTGWLASNMQMDALQKLYSLEPFIKKNSPELATWSNLQSYTYLQDMNPENAHNGSPFEAFIFYMNILSDFEAKIKPQVQSGKPQKPKSTTSASKSVVRLKPRTN
jgi:alpha-amylase